MDGLHLIADLHQCACPPALLSDRDRLSRLCLEACREHGLSVVGTLFHAFDAGPEGQSGITGAIVLAESHLALHTWPELQSVTLDIYVCNYSGDNSDKARALLASLLQHFQPLQPQLQSVWRGQPPTA